MTSHHLLTIRLDDLSDQELDQTVLSYLNGTGSKIIVTPNPEFLLLARRDKEFAELLNRADLSLPDGFGLKLAARLNGFSLHRHTGVDTLEQLMRTAGDRQILLLGSKESVEASKIFFQQKYPDLKIQIFDPGHVSDSGEAEEKIIFEIKNFAPAILAVGLGQGKQERFIAKYLPKLPSICIAIGVGGAFDMISGKKPRAPRFMRQIGLEWLWRLVIEPKRWQRIMRAVIIFPIIVICDKLRRH